MTASAAAYRGKRAFDVAVLALAAIPAAIIGTLCAFAIKVSSRGPVFYRQERIGSNGAAFQIIKFRTMLDDDNPVFPDRSRITGIGAVLRRLSLDELPELINVARGEMSIVGPRPTLRYQVERYDARQRGRLAVRPGLTGYAQTRGRNALLWSDRIELDLEYIERQSLWLDVKVLVASILVVLRGSGVEGHPTDDPLSRLD